MLASNFSIGYNDIPCEHHQRCWTPSLASQAKSSAHVWRRSAATAGMHKARSGATHAVALLLALGAFCSLIAGCSDPPGQTTSSYHRLPVAFIASIDTMKESRDTESNPLTDAQIANDIKLSASLNVNYITVDTHLNDVEYMARWVKAIRATGKHVWFRTGFTGWGAGASGAFTPAMYVTKLRAFILAHPSLFRPGDIFDSCAEPENGAYWSVTYGGAWSWQPPAPNAATDAFNQFIIDLTDTADSAFKQLGIQGVVTTVHSVDPWTAAHPDALYPDTIQHMGNLVVVDAYPDGSVLDPATAASAWEQQIKEIHTARPDAHLLIGEMGYPLKQPVDDATQERVLKAELEALAPIPYLVGVNYWVGAGTDTSGGYTHLFSGTAGRWTLRPAAYVLASYFEKTLSQRRS